MKRSIVAVALIGALVALPARAETKEMPTQIRSVIVYSDRAQVTRTGKITLPSGSRTVAVAGLPAVLDERSVKVSGEAAGASISDVRVETTYLDSVPDLRVTSLQKTIDDLKHRQSGVRNRHSALQQEAQFIQQIHPQPSTGTGDLRAPKYTADDWQKSLSFIASNLARVKAGQLEAEEEIASLQKKIDAAQKQLSEISSRLQRVTKTLLIDLDVQRGGDVALTASYVVFNARWYPQYDVRASRDAASPTADIEYRGAIQQSTGEDWTNVDLALSTARPDIGGVKPELQPWFVAEAQPVTIQPFMRRNGAAMMKTESLQAAPQPVPDAEEAPAMAPIEEVAAGVETGLTSAVYTIASKSSVPSDNVVHKVAISREKFSSEFSYLAAPKLSPFVYLKGTIKNSSEYPLLPGIMNVFSGREYIAQSSMKLVAPNETFDAYFGIDRTIGIERKLINKSTEYTGTFSKSVKVTYHFRYTLENRKKTDITVAVEDQLPVSQNERITVELIEPRDLPRTDQGFVTFTQTAKPSEKKTWDFRFSVEYPRDMKVTGIE